MFAALGRHPNVAPLFLEQTPLGPNAMAVREIGLAMFLDNGFTPELAARSYATLSRYVLGFATQVAADSDSPAAHDSAAFRGVDPVEFPATLATAHTLPVPLAVEFAFGLDLMIKGLSHIH